MFFERVPARKALQMVIYALDRRTSQASPSKVEAAP